MHIRPEVRVDVSEGNLYWLLLISDFAKIMIGGATSVKVHILPAKYSPETSVTS